MLDFMKSVCVWIFCLHVCNVHNICVGLVLMEGVGAPETELWTSVSCHVGARNLASVLCKNKDTELTTQPSRQTFFFFFFFTTYFSGRRSNSSAYAYKASTLLTEPSP